MNRSIDVRNEARRLAGSKPVQAAAGAGLLASQALRELPARLARWRQDVGAGGLSTRAGELTARAGGLSTRAGEYARTARVRAAHQYDSLAARGSKVLNGRAVARVTGSTSRKTK